MAYYLVSTLSRMELGDRISALRRAKGMSQDELAKAANCTQKAISKIERNLVRRPGYLPAIATALGFTYEELMEGVETPKFIQARTRPHTLVREKISRWPFSFTYEQYKNLPVTTRADYNGRLAALVEANETKRFKKEAVTEKRKKNVG